MRSGCRRAPTQRFRVWPEPKKTFWLEISKHEHCSSKQLATVDDFDIYVYSPTMIAAEKIRAICQQLPGYVLRAHPAPRARDFYDIHAIVEQEQIRLSEHSELVKAMFEAKQVPLALVGEIEGARSFHEAAWPIVQQTVSKPLADFDFYFDFVLGIARSLKSLWNV